MAGSLALVGAVVTQGVTAIAQCSHRCPLALRDANGCCPPSGASGRRGSVYVATQRQGTTVRIDGVESGTGAQRIDGVRPGRRVVDVRLADGTSQHFIVPVRAGATATVDLDHGVVPDIGAAPGGVAVHSGSSRQIRVNAQIHGSLEVSDTHLADGSLADDYALNVSAGSPITIVVRGGPSTDMPGSNLDMFAILLSDDVEIIHDDDSAGGPDGLNSRIVYTPTVSGRLTLRITTFGGTIHTGAYTIQTWPGILESAE